MVINNSKKGKLNMLPQQNNSSKLAITECVLHVCFTLVVGFMVFVYVLVTYLPPGTFDQPAFSAIGALLYLPFWFGLVVIESLSGLIALLAFTTILLTIIRVLMGQTPTIKWLAYIGVLAELLALFIALEVMLVPSQLQWF